MSDIAYWLRRHDLGKYVAVFAENEIVLKGLQFVNESQKSDQRCQNCVLFRAADNGRGKCQIIQKGHVPEVGWCISWAPKV